VIRTVEAVCDELCENGLVRRYRTDDQGAADGLAGGEGTFLACSFWLVDNLALAGRRNEAERLLERLLDLRNDVGLLAEEYDPSRRRLVGNFPQAFSHVGLVNSAFNLAAADSPGSPGDDASGHDPGRGKGRGDG
jgi:GH15 family glucan-1,4-alpha-glucosidase